MTLNDATYAKIAHMDWEELSHAYEALEAENEALRKLAHDYITAYEKLAFGDALLTGEDDG